MRASTVGLFVGLILGVALVLTSFGDMLIVALLGAIGFFVMKVVEGEIDLGELLSRQPRQPRRRW
jgi:hypothetical protein